MHSIENLPYGAEPIFHIRNHDITERYYRLLADEDSYLYFHEVERVNPGNLQQYYSLDTWESCWHCFVNGFETESWVSAEPSYVHEDYRHFVQSALLSEVIRKGSNVPTAFIEQWKKTLQVVPAGREE